MRRPGHGTAPVDTDMTPLVSPAPQTALQSQSEAESSSACRGSIHRFGAPSLRGFADASVSIQSLNPREMPRNSGKCDAAETDTFGSIPAFLALEPPSRPDCHAEGRGFESLHQLLAKGPQTRAFRLVGVCGGGDEQEPRPLRSRPPRSVGACCGCHGSSGRRMRPGRRDNRRCTASQRGP